MKKYTIIDAHSHIFPHKIAEKATVNIGHFYDIPMTHIGSSEKLEVSGARIEVAKFLVCSTATRPAQVESINTFIHEECKLHDKFYGFATMHPDYEHIETELDRAVEMGLHGIKLHPDIQGFQIDEPRAMKIFAMCEDKGLPIYVHTGDKRYDNSNPNRVKNVLEAFPKLKFVGPHLGGWSVWEDALKVLPKYDNIIVDTSSSLYELDPDTARDIIRAYGSERVMFGTDYPMWPVSAELKHMEALGLTDEEYENIYWRTCANLFDISFDD